MDVRRRRNGRAWTTQYYGCPLGEHASTASATHHVRRRRVRLLSARIATSIIFSLFNHLFLTIANFSWILIFAVRDRNAVNAQIISRSI